MPITSKYNLPLESDLPFHKYVWSMITDTTKIERILCSVAAATLIISIILIIYYSLFLQHNPDGVIDIHSDPWNVSRKMWLADPFRHNATTDRYDPLKLVIIQHTVTAECHVFKDCAAAVRKLQNYFLTNEDLGYDIPYNFLIGNDGRVYEGRGWNIEGAHTFKYNKCSLGVGFIGDYRQTQVTELQVERFYLLMFEGMARGHIDPKYYAIPAKDLQDTESPGTYLYNEIQNWDTYDYDYKFRGKSCDEIYGKV